MNASPGSSSAKRLRHSWLFELGRNSTVLMFGILIQHEICRRGATLSLNDFVRKIQFGDNVEDWKEKLETAREWRNALLADEMFTENLFVSTLGTGFLDELKTKLKESFQNAAEAFVFFDRSCSSVLTESEWKIGLKRLGVETGVKHLMMVLDSHSRDGKVDEIEFRNVFAWHRYHTHPTQIFTYTHTHTQAHAPPHTQHRYLHTHTQTHALARLLIHSPLLNVSHFDVI